jgi:hypothetical protein
MKNKEIKIGKSIKELAEEAKEIKTEKDREQFFYNNLLDLLDVIFDI